jgi:thioredoxin 1
MKLELQILVTLFAALSAVAASSGRSSSSSRLFGITSSQSSCGSTQRSILDIRGGAVHESSTIGDLESKIQSAALQNKLTIIDFTATWCGPCKMIAPVFKELSEEYGSRAQFIKVDVDDNPEAAQKYGVTAMPTFLFIKGGEVVDRLMVRDTSCMILCHTHFSYFAPLLTAHNLYLIYSFL